MSHVKDWPTRRKDKLVGAISRRKCEVRVSLIYEDGEPRAVGLRQFWKGTSMTHAEFEYVRIPLRRLYEFRELLAKAEALALQGATESAPYAEDLP